MTISYVLGENPLLYVPTTTGLPNDPELLKKIIAIKKGESVDTGVPYAAAEKLQQSSKPLAKLLVSLINQSQENNQ